MISRRSKAPATLRLEPPGMRRAREFLSAVERSRTLHGRFVHAPDSYDVLQAYVRRMRDDRHLGYFVITASDELAGVININEIVRGAFQSGYLGYYAFTPHAGHGLMSQAMQIVLNEAFRRQGLHRLEANIQPENDASKALVRRLGFEREGFSPRYLKIRGRWRDHERWAITVETWRERKPDRAWGRGGTAAQENGT